MQVLCLVWVFVAFWVVWRCPRVVILLCFFFVVACLAVVDYCGVCVDWLFGMLLTWLLV